MENPKKKLFTNGEPNTALKKTTLKWEFFHFLGEKTIGTVLFSLGGLLYFKWGKKGEGFLYFLRAILILSEKMTLVKFLKKFF
jgi:hypothetical protein